MVAPPPPSLPLSAQPLVSLAIQTLLPLPPHSTTPPAQPLTSQSISTTPMFLATPPLPSGRVGGAPQTAMSLEGTSKMCTSQFSVLVLCKVPVDRFDHWWSVVAPHPPWVTDYEVANIHQSQWSQWQQCIYIYTHTQTHTHSLKLKSPNLRGIPLFTGSNKSYLPRTEWVEFHSLPWQQRNRFTW